MRRCEIPGVTGVLSPEDCAATGRAIAAEQESSGAIPWFTGGHTDPWDHIENAMALSVTGLIDAAEGAYEWSRSTQRPDGSWPLQFRNGVVEDPHSDTNFCAYIAVGVWHHYLITGDDRFIDRMWPVVQRAIDFVLDLQNASGTIGWARTPKGDFTEALLTGCSSIHQALRCALAIAAHVDDPQPEWEVAVGRLRHAIADHPEEFSEKMRYSMDWYYPILGGALRGTKAHHRIELGWDDYVVDGLGIRCVSDRPWVTGAETCELVLALDTLARPRAAHEQFAAMQHLREADGSYWTGLVFADGKRWPEERTTWTGAAVVLAADALSRTTPGNGIFRGEHLPLGLEGSYDCECVTQR
ncbi:prenyltransferase [Aldersonia kunmingensis]|uniref:prenyltransferase n=1 Tax=Aldersonia kunmingensis TaxID=408066 RepID=UPI00082AD59C|nr:prenyltransferase [Aldersonia kunmingensis]